MNFFSKKAVRQFLYSPHSVAIIFFCLNADLLAADMETSKLSSWSLAAEVMKEQAGTTWPEIKSIASAPFENPEKSAKWGLFLAGLILVDKPLTRYYQQNVESRINYSLPNLFNSPITAGADGYLLFGVASHYFGGVITASRKAQETSIMAGKAITYSYLFAQLIGKSLTGRNRPYSDLGNCSGAVEPFTCDPYDWGHWHGVSPDAASYGTAMPSFHFTMYFSVARIYARSYDNYWLPYSVMAGLLGSDISGHRHWVSDMVAGGLLGTLIGNRIYDSHLNQRSKRKFMAAWEFFPYAVSNGIGLHMTRNL